MTVLSYSVGDVKDLIHLVGDMTVATVGDMKGETFSQNCRRYAYAPFLRVLRVVSSSLSDHHFLFLTAGVEISSGAS